MQNKREIDMRLTLTFDIDLETLARHHPDLDPTQAVIEELKFVRGAGIHVLGLKPETEPETQPQTEPNVRAIYKRGIDNIDELIKEFRKTP